MSQIKCYHKNTLSSGRDIIFRCQFHTGAIKDHGLVLDKTELDDACKGLYRVVVEPFFMYVLRAYNVGAYVHWRVYLPILKRALPLIFSIFLKS